jgi:hypothetical protein
MFNVRYPKEEKRTRKTFGEWVATTQGVVTIVATVVTLVFGGGGILAAKHMLWSSQPSLTESQLAGSLLTPTDLTSISTNFTALNAGTGYPTSCDAVAAERPQPTLSVTRELINAGQKWDIWEAVSAFDSPADAHTSLTQLSQYLSCLYGSQEDLFRDVSSSSSLNGLCDENRSWAISSSGSFQVGWSNFRCGKFIVEVEVYPQTSSAKGIPALNGIFPEVAGAATEKVQSLPGGE